MAKAIKHIKAGELHIEVIGQIPDQEHKRRSARTRRTSPAQAFYNNKCSWQELELVIATNFTNDDWVVTYTYDNDHLPKDKKAAQKELQKHFRKVRAVRRLRGADLLYAYTTEGYHKKSAVDFLGEDGYLEDGRLHHHVVLNGLGPGDREELQSLWHGGGYIRVEPLDLRYVRELAKYMTKEAREFGRPKPGERTWNASRNLKKYEVTYEEIRSNSVTLAAPPGAEYCTAFDEVNPYGFGHCIGIRYFLREQRPRRRYSYNLGRRPKIE